MLNGVERSGKVNKAVGRWLLLAMAEFKDPSLCEYLMHASTPSTKSNLVRWRPRVAHRLEPPEENNGEDPRSNVDEAYVAVVLTSHLISLLMDRHNDV
ncbi:unnamed protein product [Dibothriocephalus latus]|uniref:Uncharacterized protein n=1 Tax=Dibothriocephalus latus TaxID=60516 RepID=A0A3P7NP20_DIBLA|nr:unnamed protein product [Dibothriocephalus latus]